MSESAYALIEKAMSDPNVPADKLSQVIAFHETQQTRAAMLEYLEAMSGLQGELPSVRKGSQTNMNTYATFDTTMDVVRPFFQKYGFSFATQPRARDDGQLEITSTIQHAGGHSVTTVVTASLDDSGKKSKIQQFGSTLKYVMRYNLVALLSISTHDGDDDDGTVLSYCTEGEALALEEFCKDNELDAARYFKYYAKVYKQPIASWGEFPAGSYDAVIKFMESQTK